MNRVRVRVPDSVMVRITVRIRVRIRLTAVFSSVIQSHFKRVWLEYESSGIYLSVS